MNNEEWTQLAHGHDARCNLCFDEFHFIIHGPEWNALVAHRSIVSSIGHHFCRSIASNTLPVASVLISILIFILTAPLFLVEFFSCGCMYSFWMNLIIYSAQIVSSCAYQSEEEETKIMSRRRESDEYVCRFVWHSFTLNASWTNEKRRMNTRK